ncbi:unnamed protein product [Mytilus coruscus]|uniref:EGF-like domain-containing protein n=1 Tax=Mytilus coruscus TaxID=42192 RepID=A0A6J8BWU1_MYTCO|nr:unnamed protein product [Mytilus coruscus]
MHVYRAPVYMVVRVLRLADRITNVHVHSDGMDQLVTVSKFYEVNPCLPNPCNQRTCHPTGSSSHTCSCSFGWYGTNCNAPDPMASTREKRENAGEKLKDIIESFKPSKATKHKTEGETHDDKEESDSESDGKFAHSFEKLHQENDNEEIHAFENELKRLKTEKRKVELKCKIEEEKDNLIQLQLPPKVQPLVTENPTKGIHLLIDTLRRLDFNISWNKIEGPSQSLTFLRIVINTCSLSLAMPDKKRREFHDVILSFQNHKRASEQL